MPWKSSGQRPPPTGGRKSPHASIMSFYAFAAGRKPFPVREAESYARRMRHRLLSEV